MAMKEYKVIVAGGRDYMDAAEMLGHMWDADAAAKERGMHIAIVSGMARGADLLGRALALEHGAKVYEFPADWDRYGKSAGFKRNEQMAQFADALLAFWDGSSRGTAHMIETMRKAGKPVQVVRY